MTERGAHGHEDCAHTGALAAAREGRANVLPRLSLAFGLTAVFFVAELVGGLVSNSLALLADAGHMLTDVGALGLALFVAWWNRRLGERGNDAHQRREAWAALVNGTLLFVVCGVILFEAWQRFGSPETVRTGLMLAVASGGLVINVAVALVLRPIVRGNLNVRGAYLHVLGDLLGSVGTVAAALIIRQTGFLAADPIASVVVCALVLRAAYGLLRDARASLRRTALSHSV